MASPSLNQLIPVLQVAIGPVILISGIGLLLLTLTNRFGRATDRSRQLAKELRGLPPEQRNRLKGQIVNLFRRAKLIRLSIIFAALSVLLAALLIIVLFLTALLKLEVGLLIATLFMACMVALICSLGAFLQDIQLSLVALQLELENGENY